MKGPQEIRIEINSDKVKEIIGPLNEAHVREQIINSKVRQKKQPAEARRGGGFVQELIRDVLEVSIAGVIVVMTIAAVAGVALLVLGNPFGLVLAAPAALTLVWIERHAKGDGKGKPVLWTIAEDETA